LLRCNHHIGDIDSWRALFVPGGHCRRCFLYFVNLVDGLRHYLAKARCFIDTFDVNRAELAHAADFIRSDAWGPLERLRLRFHAAHFYPQTINVTTISHDKNPGWWVWVTNSFYISAELGDNKLAVCTSRCS